MKNTLPPVLLHFVPPALKLRHDKLDSCGLFNVPRLDSFGVLIAEFGYRKLRY
jgi:hypothetical protein